MTPLSHSTIYTEPLVPAGMSLLLNSDRRNGEAARIAAELATLPNVRRRAGTDAEAWSQMADRLARFEAMRDGKEKFQPHRAVSSESLKE